MSNISKRRREGSRPKIKSMGDHNEFLKRITKTLYYGELPELPCLSLPVTEVSCALWSAAQQGRSLRRLHCDAAARMTRGACVSPCALVLAVLYLERLRHRNPDYLATTAPADLFLVSLMIGNKFLQDDGEEAEVLCAEWAAAAGVPRAHLKQLEIHFLDAIEWNVYVNNESFESGLAGLERRVALKQALGRGFFTYGDLCCAGAGAADLCAAAAAAAALAAAYVAAVAALLASALLLAQATAPLPPAPLPNATLAAPTCCPAWRRHSAESNPKPHDVAWTLEPFSKSVLSWLSRSSLDPMRRWLERLGEDAAVFAETPSRRCGAGACAWLNLSRLGGLAVVSDR